MSTSEVAKLTARKRIELLGFNPYSSRYPGRRVLSRDALLLAKRLRTAGHEVVVLPKTSQPVQFVAKKGFHDVLQDPLVIYAVGIPINIVVGIVSAWIYDTLRRRGQRKDPITTQSNIVISISEDGRTIRYDHAGREISEERFRSLLGQVRSGRGAYARSISATPPDPTLPIPIFLEHSPRIVGWARVEGDERGIHVSPAKIHDKGVLHDIDAGKLRGFSVSGIVTEAICSRCGGSFVSCNHGSREDPHEDVTVTLQGIDACEISVVSDPVNPDAIIADHKIARTEDT